MGGWYMFVVALHVMLCLFLILIIILQPGKGGDVGAAFGGSSGSSSMFGPRGPTSLLQRATTLVAVMFMATSLTLAIFSNKSMLADSNVEDELDRLANEEQVEEQPAPEEAPAPDEGVVPEAPENE